jgi:hypothetical protein
MMERDNLKDPGINGRIILQWIFRKWDVEVWTVIDVAEGTVACTCE